jgi:hypothetical protein
MRRRAIGSEDIELIDDLLADIAVQVVACRDGQSGPTTARAAEIQSPSASSIPSTLIAPCMAR